MQISKIAVIDSSALISGMRVNELADKCFTTEGVIRECRDISSRFFISCLPLGIEILEPSADEFQIVFRFAFGMGNLCVLSFIDLQLAALTRTVFKYAYSHYQCNSKLNLIKDKNLLRNHAIKEKSEFQIHPINKNKPKVNYNLGLSEFCENFLYFSNKCNRKNILLKVSSDCVGCKSRILSEDKISLCEIALDENPRKVYPLINASIEILDFKILGICNSDCLDEISMNDHLSSNLKSSVVCVTGDFALQNLILEMGVGVVDGNGMLVEKLLI